MHRLIRRASSFGNFAFGNGANQVNAKFAAVLYIRLGGFGRDMEEADLAGALLLVQGREARVVDEVAQESAGVFRYSNVEGGLGQQVSFHTIFHAQNASVAGHIPC